MDPLSVAASVTGLLAAGGKLIAILTHISRLSDTPSLCKSALTEVCDTTAALRQIQDLISDGSQLEGGLPRKNGKKILLENVATALVGCVMTKDELESVLDNLGLVYHQEAGGFSIRGVFDKTRWVLKEEEIGKMVQRLQCHKLTLNLILTTLHCTTSVQIQQSVDRLHALVRESLSNNSTLEERLRRLEDEGNNSDAAASDSDSGDSAATIHVAAPREQYAQALPLAVHQASHQEVRRIPVNVNEILEGRVAIQSNRAVRYTSLAFSEAFPFAFDSDLKSSKVYKRAFSRIQSGSNDAHSETSLTTATRQKRAESVFLATSIAEVSNISFYSLPIFIHEVVHSRWYTPGSQQTKSAAPITARNGAIDLTILDDERREVQAILEKGTHSGPRTHSPRVVSTKRPFGNRRGDLAWS